MELKLELKDNGLTDIDEVYFNLEAIRLAIEGIGEISAHGTVPEPAIFGVKNLIGNTLNLLKPHVTFFCTECESIFKNCECKKEA